MPDSEWDALARHAVVMRGRTLRELFEAEPFRDRMHVEAAGWYFDYAKHRVSGATLELLFDLIIARGRLNKNSINHARREDFPVGF